MMVTFLDFLLFCISTKLTVTLGNRVWANPRALVACMRQCNTTDVTRRSPSYEVRLAKYAARGFEVYVSNLNRKDIDPTVRI